MTVLIFRGYLFNSIILYFYLFYNFTKSDEIEQPDPINPIEDLVLTESEDNTTQIEDQIEEEWVNEAVRDVAYYLRSHKFNDYDRRYQKETNAAKDFYKGFPNPPLVQIHWEVYKYCSKGFTECVGYLQETALRADIYRSIDTATVINERGWELPRNLLSVEALNSECIRLRNKDWIRAQPFKGPLERFQWRTSASYYMCWYTMQEIPSLALFGERCDNFAFCVDPPYYLSKHYDPRANDRYPYQCALYSFCPDPCCPKRLVGAYPECHEAKDNPCIRDNPKNKNECSYQRKNNLHLEAIALNQWNVSCHCEPGYVFESRFDMCVDIDECALGTDSCDRNLETCINLKGEFTCSCSWGYEWSGERCEPSISLLESISAYNGRNQPEPVNSSGPFSFFKYLFNFSIALFDTDDSEKKDKDFNRGLPDI